MAAGRSGRAKRRPRSWRAHPGATGSSGRPTLETAMDKAGKAVALEAYKNVFANAGVIVVTQYSGLTVRELTDLRVKLKGEGASLKVIKNRLAKIALDGKGGDKAGAMFVGPVAIAYSPDPVAASKVVADFAKGNEKLVLIGATHGRHGARPGRREAACFAAVAGPAPRQDHRPHPGACDQDRRRRGCARRLSWPASLALTPTRTLPETCLPTLKFEVTHPNIKETLKCRNWTKSSRTCRR